MAIPDLQSIVISVPGVVIGFAFHEFAHAITATWFGDDTPRHQGRVTLNPIAHLDPLGTLLLLVGGFGWARPVLVDSRRLRPRILGDIMVSLAGVIMNFLLAVVFAILTLLAYQGKLFYSHPVLTQTLSQVAWMNVLLVGFNLLPLPPLDGFRVIRHLLPDRFNEQVMRLYQFGPFILIALFAFDIINLGPLYQAILSAVMAVAKPVVQLL